VATHHQRIALFGLFFRVWRWREARSRRRNGRSRFESHVDVLLPERNPADETRIHRNRDILNGCYTAVLAQQGRARASERFAAHNAAYLIGGNLRHDLP